MEKEKKIFTTLWNVSQNWVWGNFPRPFVMSLSLKSVRIYLIQTKKDYIDGKNKNTPQRKAQRRTLNPMQIYAVDANLPWCIQLDSLPCSCFILQVKAMETFRHAFSLIPLIDTKISNNTRSLNQIGQNKYYETGQQCNSKVCLFRYRSNSIYDLWFPQDWFILSWFKILKDALSSLKSKRGNILVLKWAH